MSCVDEHTVSCAPFGVELVESSAQVYRLVLLRKALLRRIWLKIVRKQENFVHISSH